jgi:hypothetical protein
LRIRSARLPLARDCLPRQKTAEGSALINVALNLGGSFGVSLANTELLQRPQFHQARRAGKRGRAGHGLYRPPDRIAGGNPRLNRHLLQLGDLYCLSHSYSAAAGPAVRRGSGEATAMH